jgi:hypothetical protein
MRDAVVASAADNRVRVLLGDRTGAFSAGVTYTASTPNSVYLATKMDKDSQPDLAYTELGANQVTYRLGLPDGTFGNATSFPVDSPARVVVEDVSWTFQDIIVTSTGDNTVDVMLGFGDGTFDQPTHWAVGTSPAGIAVGAFDPDSGNDLTIANTTSGDVTLMLNATPRGNDEAPPLQFVPTSMPLGAGATDVVTADLNGDAKLDLAAVAAGDGSAGSGGVSVSFGDGNGAFTPFSQVLAGRSPVAIAAADLTVDGALDLVVANSATNDVSVFVNNGSGGFTLKATLPVGAAPKDVGIERVDRGTASDVVVVSEAGDSLIVFPGKNDGTFKAPVTTSVSNPVALALRDLNRDRNIDVVVASATDGLVRVMLGDKTGAFAAGATYPASMPNSVYIANRINRDRAPDLAYTELGANQVTYRLGADDGTFGAPTSFPVASPTRVVVEDVTYDTSDLIVTSQSGNSVDVILGQQDGSFDPPQHIAVGTGPVGIAIGAFDSAFAPDMAIANVTSGDVVVMINRTPRPPTTNEG